jgi:tRNA pseudouridine55 synthase
MQEGVNGVIVIDKPENISSSKVVAFIRKTLKVKKAGHTGTLDPFATGVLVCCLNQATRLARFFLHGGKKYRAELRLGIETDTQDSTGVVTATREVGDFAADDIRSAFNRFQGKILQLPPVFSALKHQGVPLYKLARQGRPVQKPAREVTITSLEIQEIALPYVRFEVACSGGTYIRTLCADIGAELGCGGHLNTLRRTESTGFSETEAIALPDVEKLVQHGEIADRIIPMGDALREIPAYHADSALVEKIAYGRTLIKEDFLPAQITHMKDLIKIIDENDNLCAVLDVQKNHGPYKYCCVFN